MASAAESNATEDLSQNESNLQLMGHRKSFGRLVSCSSCGHDYSLSLQESIVEQGHDLNYCVNCGAEFDVV